MQSTRWETDAAVLPEFPDTTVTERNRSDRFDHARSLYHAAERPGSESRSL
jgi:hypothetical protein